jgi:NAD(P)-dependent dehydrogenase (short-subunit alcohol dehydrogenase family)
VKQVFEFVQSKYGRVDCLWNNAGVQGHLKPILDYPADDFLKIQQINVVGAFNVLKHCAQKMSIQQSGGAIVQSGSISATDGTPAMCAYAASKAALHALSLTAAKDLAPFNIRVNTVSPGYIGPTDGHLWKRQIDLRTTSGSPYLRRTRTKKPLAQFNPFL